jgi:hypothetical protein
MLNVWIAGELVASLLDRNLALEDVHTDFYGTVSVIGAFGPQRDAARDRQDPRRRRALRRDRRAPSGRRTTQRRP